AGGPGFEPGIKAPKALVIPFHHPPMRPWLVYRESPRRATQPGPGHVPKPEDVSLSGALRGAADRHEGQVTRWSSTTIPPPKAGFRTPALPLAAPFASARRCSDGPE